MTGDVIRLIARLERKPAVLVSGSAIGWYGLWQDQVLTESAKSHACFSHELCDAWENAARPAEDAWRAGRLSAHRPGAGDRRRVHHADADAVRVRPRRAAGLGQAVDVVDRARRSRAPDRPCRSQSPKSPGPINATAPIPVTNLKFTEELGRRLHRPAIFRIPAALLRRLGGDFADELLLGGQRVLPNKALSNGFVFRHETLRSAFDAIL